MIVVRRNRTDITEKLNRVLMTNGISLNDTIGKELVTTSVDSLELEYSSYYEFAKNTRIDTADNIFLDSYGLLLDEPRDSASFGYVNDLETVSIFLLNGAGRTISGKNLTSDGKGILIEKGTILKDKNGSPVLKTLTSVYLTDTRVYVNAVALNPGSFYLPVNGLAGVDLDIRNITNVSPSLVSDFNLMCNNEKEITNGTESADPNTYRFVLQEKGHSVNLANLRKLNTLLDNLNLRKMVVDRGNRNSTTLVVYIESKNIELDEILIEEIRNQIETIFPYATDIRVRTFIYTTVSANLKITVNPLFDTPATREDFKQVFVRELIALEGGVPVNFTNFINNLKREDSRILGVDFEELLINNRSLSSNLYQTKKIEKLIAYPSTISYKI